MRIAIIGAGAIGSVVAAYLTKVGEDVLLIGREDQVQAINEKGLKITGVRGDETIRIKAATQMDSESDLVIFTTKTQDLEAAYQHNHEFLENGCVLTSQNGVQADNILGVHFERVQMLSSIVMFGATFVKPGEVTFNFEGNWVLGKPYTSIDPKTQEIADVLRKAFPVEVTDDIMGMKYLKLFVNFNNCIPALIGKSMQETFADKDLCRLSILLLREGVEIVNRAKIKLASLPTFPTDRIYGLTSMPVDQAADIIQKTLTTLSDKPVYGSILQSIMRGKPSEIDFINGEVVLLAAQMRVEADLNRKTVKMVHQVEQTKKYFTMDEVKKEFNLVNCEA